MTKIINYVQDRDEEGKQNDSWTPIYSCYIPRAAFLRAEITHQSNTLTRLRRKASSCLLAWVRGTQWGPGWKRVMDFSLGQVFWIGWWPRLHLETRHCCSQGTPGLASMDPCPPVPSPVPWRETDLIAWWPWASPSMSLNLSFPFYKMVMKRTSHQSLGLWIIRANSCQVLSVELGTQKVLSITSCYYYYFYCSSWPILHIKNWEMWSGCGCHPCSLFVIIIVNIYIEFTVFQGLMYVDSFNPAKPHE